MPKAERSAGVKTDCGIGGVSKANLLRGLAVYLQRSAFQHPPASRAANQ